MMYNMSMRVNIKSTAPAVSVFVTSGWRDSNPRSPAPKAGGLPLAYIPVSSWRPEEPCSGESHENPRTIPSRTS